MIRLNKQSVQIVVGTQAESIARAMKTVLEKGPVPAAGTPEPAARKAAENTPQQATRNSTQPVVATLVAPVSGKVVAIEDVPDEAFASKAVGDGLAILPSGSTVVSPLSGTVVKIFATHHAFCLESECGAEVVVHMGLDTVALEGNGFRCLITEGDSVVAGQPILEMDLDYLNSHARSMISPVVISNIDDYSGLTLLAGETVVAGETEIYQIKG